MSIMRGFVTMIRDISDVVYDVSAATISNAAAISTMNQGAGWEETIPVAGIKVLGPSANDISGILLGNTIIQGTDFSGIIIGDGNDAQTSYSIALGQGAVASGTEKFVYRDACDNRFVFDTAAGGQFLINGTAPSGSGGGTTVPGDLLVHGTMETSGVILAPIHSAEGSSQSVNMELDPSKNPLMTKGMLWINEAQDESAGWSYVAPMDISMSGVVCASLGGKIYACGGGIFDAAAGPGAGITLVYDPITNSWSSIAPMDISRGQLGVAALGGKLYGVGGYLLGAPPSLGPATDAVEVYDPSTNSWNYIAPMNTARGGLAVVALGDKLYAVAGATGGALNTGLSSVEVYDPITNSWNYIASMSIDRYAPVAAALAGKLYVAGGASYPGTYLNSVEVYDPITNSWSSIASMNQPRWAAACAALEGKLYVVGGGTGAGVYTDTTEVYDPITDSWTTLPHTLADDRALLGLTALAGRLYTIGGLNLFSPTSTTPTSAVEVYDPSLVQMPQITYQGEDFYISHQRGGPKTFVIPHPEHEGKMLRHACLEAPTRGTNVYEYQITTTEDNQTTEIALPSYFKHINGRPRVYVYSGTGSQWGGSRGYMSDDHTKAFIETEKPGTYNVMVTGVRKDPEAVAYSATENIDDPIDPKDI